MLQSLHLDLLTIMILATISQTANVAVLKWWGSIADRMSNKSVLQVCAPLFIGCIFAWTFTTFPEPHALTLPLLVAIHILTGFATAGVTLASGNIALKLAPRGDATAYLANNSLVNSMAAGIAPVIGGLFADVFIARELSLNLHWRAPGEEVSFDTLSIGHWDFFFVLATVIGLYSIHRLRLVREVGEVGERMVLHEALLGVKRSVRNLSTIAGLRSATEYPFGAVREEKADDDHGTPPASPPLPPVAPGRATLEARTAKPAGEAEGEVGG